MDDSQRRHWEIRTNLGRHVHPSGDGSGWLWEVSRDDQVARVMIEISEAAWSADPWVCLRRRAGRSRRTVEPSS